MLGKVLLALKSHLARCWANCGPPVLIFKPYPPAVFATLINQQHPLTNSWPIHHTYLCTPLLLPFLHRRHCPVLYHRSPVKTTG